MYALGLRPGGGIGTLLGPVQPVEIGSTGRSVFRHGLMVPVFVTCEQNGSLPRRENADLHSFHVRRVDEEPATAIPQGRCAEGERI